MDGEGDRVARQGGVHLICEQMTREDDKVY
jgi:hypothetical protein